MELFPDSTTLLSLGSFSLPFYALSFLIGTSFVAWLSYQEAKKKGIRRELNVEIIAVTILGAILISRVFWVLENLNNYLKYLPYIFALNDGGFSIVGGLFGATIFISLHAKERHLSALQILDFVAPLYLGASAIIRMARALERNSVWFAIFLDTVGAFMIWYLFRPYRHGFKRGQAFALTFIWLGLSTLITTVFKWDPNLKSQFILEVITEALGLCLLYWVYQRKVDKPILLFDLDGTIMDSRRMVLYCYAYLFKKYSSLKNFTMERQEEVFGASLKEEIEKFFPNQDANVLVQEYRQYQRSFSWSKEVSLFPETQETLEYLWQQGYTIGLVSSRLTESCESWLKQLHLDHCFSVVVGRDQVKHPKPSPEGIFFACQRLKVSSSNAIYIGDNVTDIQAAKKAGVFAVGFNTEQRKLAQLKKEKPNVIIHQLDELKDVLKANHAWTYDKM
ncbi:prolipoprotein diacylglyceryl transferase family protein [Bulleidia sp. zg-1006]|uniref:prolipoprotein diacylglyceryl transferase family protein n=1 Tax=Bulleidia sp. zg-1006 TaxID=2806552 RepID=UPI00193AABC1|nr:prolipoprotein diacylglyceryl transferase family protein [Bulleidia sp. zg-1006]QRG86783.1 HAD-IA family hydrolase [Bulleidia sp. zg-1006]